MKTETLTEIQSLRNAAKATANFWPMWREKYLPDSRCDKKRATFIGPDDRFASFSFKLMFDAHAGYYGNSNCSTIFHLDNALAQKYFTKAIQEMAAPLFERAAELMLEDAAALADKAKEEISALQAMLADVCSDEAQGGAEAA